MRREPPGSGALFEMLQSGIHNLRNSIQAGTKQIALFVEAPVDISKSLIHPFFNIAKTFVINQEADQNGQRRQPDSNSRNNYLSERTPGSILAEGQTPNGQTC